MKLRIIQQGWQGYSDTLGGVRFVDGVSAEPVSQAVAQRLAAILQIETVTEDGGAGVNPSPSQVLIDSADKPASVDLKPAVMTTDVGVKVLERGVDAVQWTREELEKIASDKGIGGLREITEGTDIKGNKIVDLIEKILKAGIVKPVVPGKVAGDDTTILKQEQGESRLHQPRSGEKNADQAKVEEQVKTDVVNTPPAA
jgi:hypothetical protein